MKVQIECSQGSDVTFSLFFVNFSVTQLKLFSGKAKLSLQKGLNLMSAIESILETRFGAILSSKAIALNL